ncbi:MAG: hypothetical protein JXR10_14675 [Cyclobacteriaceae bacterium]
MNMWKTQLFLLVLGLFGSYLPQSHLQGTLRYEKESVSEPQLPIEIFWNRFSFLISENDSSEVPSLFLLPLLDMPKDFDPDQNGLTKAELLDAYSVIFSNEVKKKLLTLDISDLVMVKNSFPSLNLDSEFLHYIPINTHIWDAEDEEYYSSSLILYLGKVKNEIKIVRVVIAN